MTGSGGRRVPAVGVLGGLLAAVAALFVVSEPTPPPRPARVRLVVLVVFDQLRGDYLERWGGHFGPGGFRRLQTAGAWYTHCHYPYATTTTGPGHASLLTGAPPADTGIINNEWYDRGAAAEAYCAGETRFALVPASPEPTSTAATTAKPKQYGAPTRLLAPTVADVLKRASGGKGKVFGVSLKDRSAILPTGRHPDGAFWFDRRFVTSTYYADAVPEWVAAFNRSGRAEAYFGKNWERYRPDLNYDTLAGPDGGEGEGTGTGQGVKFPHPTTGGKDKEGQPFASVKAAGGKYYEALANSPFGNELLLEFAKACIDAEGLGADDTPDLLTVSFSSNDLIGHTWGPDSHEVLDVTLRSDDVLAELLTHLDSRIGAGNYAVILTADHGVCPLPESAAGRTKDARRVSGLKLLLGAETRLRAKFGKPDDPEAKADAPRATRWIESLSPPHVYLNHKLAKARGVRPEAVADELAAWARTQDGVAKAYTAGELAKPADADDSVGQMVRRAYRPDRGGDVYVVLQPYHLIDSPTSTVKTPTGTTHGTPYSYDTHVPLMVLGPGVSEGTKADAVTPLHAAPIAAHFLGVPPPSMARYPVPAGLLR